MGSSQAALSQALQQPGEQKIKARSRILPVHQPGTRRWVPTSPITGVPREGRMGDAKGLHQSLVTASWGKFRLPAGALPAPRVPSTGFLCSPQPTAWEIKVLTRQLATEALLQPPFIQRL